MKAISLWSKVDVEQSVLQGRLKQFKVGVDGFKREAGACLMYAETFAWVGDGGSSFPFASLDGKAKMGCISD